MDAIRKQSETAQGIIQDMTAIATQLQQITVKIQGVRPISRRRRRQSGAEQIESIGSGVIWRSNGLIISNAHVATQPEMQVRFADGRTVNAQVIQRDLEVDLAALQINEAELAKVSVKPLTAATVRKITLEESPLRVGELVVAIGNPQGITGALSTGIIHSLPSGHNDWVQADIRLAPGNSGGALADATGRVIGINSMIVNGRGFAISSQRVERFLQTLRCNPPSSCPSLCSLCLCGFNPHPIDPQSLHLSFIYDSRFDRGAFDCSSGRASGIDCC